MDITDVSNVCCIHIFNHTYLGNCRNAKCTALQWSSWQPQVSAGQCINQARFYDYNATYKYYQQENHCGGFVKDCPEKVTSRRIYCMLAIAIELKFKLTDTQDVVRARNQHFQYFLK